MQLEIFAFTKSKVQAYQANQNTRGVLIKEHWAVHILGLHKLIWLIPIHLFFNILIAGNAS